MPCAFVVFRLTAEIALSFINHVLLGNFRVGPISTFRHDTTRHDRWWFKCQPCKRERVEREIIIYTMTYSNRGKIFFYFLCNIKYIIDTLIICVFKILKFYFVRNTNCFIWNLGLYCNENELQYNHKTRN